MTDLLSRISNNISKHRLIERRQSVLLAVSGGIDSIVLLHALAELSRSNGWRIAVAHLNHQLRGHASDADERLVQRVAEKLKLKFFSERADVKAVAVEQKLSIEMAARKVRHEFLARSARQLKIRAVALAHHADDQSELFFLRLLRGTGGEGLGGMKWKNPSPVDRNVLLIRPLLDVPKKALKEFAEERKIRFREDATNAALDFQRNRIRHELLPLLKAKYQPALGKIVARLMETAGAESEFLNQIASDWLKGSKNVAFDSLHVAVQRRCIQLQLIEQGIAPNFDLIEALRIGPQLPVMVSPKQTVLRDAVGRIHVCHTSEQAAIADSRELKLSGRAGEIQFGKLAVGWSLSSGKTSGIPKRFPGRESFDADKVGSSIILRHWRPGDRFQPIGMPMPVKLQDLFTNVKIPRERRHELVVATTETGELFWVENLRISELFKITDATIRRLLWRWSPR